MDIDKLQRSVLIAAIVVMIGIGFAAVGLSIVVGDAFWGTLVEEVFP